jgi:hypothetical protein
MTDLFNNAEEMIYYLRKNHMLDETNILELVYERFGQTLPIEEYPERVGCEGMLLFDLIEWLPGNKHEYNAIIATRYEEQEEIQLIDNADMVVTAFKATPFKIKTHDSNEYKLVTDSDEKVLYTMFKIDDSYYKLRTVDPSNKFNTAYQVDRDMQIENFVFSQKMYKNAYKF